MNYAALFYFNVAGADAQLCAGQIWTATHIIKILAEGVLARRNGMTIFDTDYPTPGGICTRDYVYVSDLADARLLALHHLLAVGVLAIRNVSYGQRFSVREFIDTGKMVPAQQYTPKRLSTASATHLPSSALAKRSFNDGAGSPNSMTFIRSSRARYHGNVSAVRHEMSRDQLD